MIAAIFYAKTQMGWKETVVNEQANKDGKPFWGTMRGSE